MESKVDNKPEKETSEVKLVVSYGEDTTGNYGFPRQRCDAEDSIRSSPSKADAKPIIPDGEENSGLFGFPRMRRDLEDEIRASLSKAEANLTLFETDIFFELKTKVVNAGHAKIIWQDQPKVDYDHVTDFWGNPMSDTSYGLRIGTIDLLVPETKERIVCSFFYDAIRHSIHFVIHTDLGFTVSLKTPNWTKLIHKYLRQVGVGGSYRKHVRCVEDDAPSVIPHTEFVRMLRGAPSCLERFESKDMSVVKKAVPNAGWLKYPVMVWSYPQCIDYPCMLPGSATCVGLFICCPDPLLGEDYEAIAYDPVEDAIRIVHGRQHNKKFVLSDPNWITKLQTYFKKHCRAF